MDSLKLLVLGVCALALAACQETPSGKSQSVSSQAGKSHYIVYMDEEKGVEPFQTRIIITPKHLRMDDGEGSEDYLLFDRASRTIHSINTQNRTDMLVREKQIELQPPFALVYSVKDLGNMKDAPTINEHVPRHFQYLTNDTVCLDVVSLPELMPDAVAALREFHEVLASDSASTFSNLPADMHVPCVMSLSTFAPTQHLQNGFPIREWKQGYSRMLVDFREDYQADPALFELPADYFTYSVQQLREGKIDFANRRLLTEEAQQ